MRRFPSRAGMLTEPLKIGTEVLRNRIALAPMAGLSDVPLRTLAWRFGAGYLVSEMVGAKPELWETGKSRTRRVPVPGATPNAVQLAGTEPEVLAEAARRHVDAGAAIIDLNFGCPAKKVCRRLAGSALLGDLDRVRRIVAAVSAAVAVPVTAKTRTGLVPGDGVVAEFARAAVDNGASMLVVHARSRACRFEGPVDHSAVACARAAVPVPILINGDIEHRADAEAAMAASGADGVMIGRAVLGQPWLFAELSGRAVPDLAAKIALVGEHVAMMHEFYGEWTGLLIARKHVAAYCRRLGVGPLVTEFQRIERADRQLEWLGGTFADTVTARHTARAA